MWARTRGVGDFHSNCGKVVDELENSENEQRDTVFDGELHKCPSCGERLDSFVTVCPACGYELRDVKRNSSVENLAKKIEQALSRPPKVGP